jgi:hypothetical protein
MTPSQIEAARQLKAFLHDRDNCVGVPFNDRDADALRTLLSATAPPSEEELAEEASAWAKQAGPVGWQVTERAYIAGARREGRK